MLYHQVCRRDVTAALGAPQALHSTHKSTLVISRRTHAPLRETGTPVQLQLLFLLDDRQSGQ